MDYQNHSLTNLQIEEKNISAGAFTAGLSILIMAIAAGYSVGFVNSTLILPNDALSTFENIQGQEILFRSGIVGWFIIFICDILAAWGLYQVFKLVNPSLSLLTAWFRITYAMVLAIAMSFLILILTKVNNTDNSLGIEFLSNNVFNNVIAFNEIWSFGLITFGIHLILLGHLTYRSRFIPKILGILVIIAGYGYIIVHLGNLLIPDFDKYKNVLENIFMAPMIIGELGLGLWLIIKGKKIKLNK